MDAKWLSKLRPWAGCYILNTALYSSPNPGSYRSTKFCHCHRKGKNASAKRIGTSCSVGYSKLISQYWVAEAYFLLYSVHYGELLVEFASHKRYTMN